MDYVLVAFMHLGHWEAGGAMTARFNSFKGCKLAQAELYKQQKVRVDFSFCTPDKDK